MTITTSTINSATMGAIRSGELTIDQITSETDALVVHVDCSPKMIDRIAQCAMPNSTRLKSTCTYASSTVLIGSIVIILCPKYDRSEQLLTLKSSLKPLHTNIRLCAPEQIAHCNTAQRA